MVHRVAVVAIDGAVVLDLGIPTQAFLAVEDENGQLRYSVEVCSIDGEPIMTTAGFQAAVAHDLSLLDTADTIIVSASRGADGTIDDRLRIALHAAHKRGARIASICTGAFFLAAAGLLDGIRATTHWKHTERFRALFPHIALDADVLYVDEGQILTSAGVSAGIDLCLHLIRLDFGARAANASARRMVVSPLRPGGQAQFIERERPCDDGDRLSSVMHWAAGNLSEDLSVEALAARARMSARSFTRHFGAHSGQSPARWVTAQRLGYAKELLEETDLGIAEIGRHSGIGSATHLRNHFHRAYAQTPSEYRRTFRAARGSVTKTVSG